MSIKEKMELIEEKKKQIDKYMNYQIFNLIKFSLICLACFIICAGAGVSIILYSWYVKQLEILTLAEVLCFGFAGVILIIGVPTIIFVGFKKHKAPKEIEKLESEVKSLENDIKEITDKISSKKKEIKEDNHKKTEDLDLLIKYKELLDKNIITEEEFNQKKKELLK